MTTPQIPPQISNQHAAATSKLGVKKPTRVLLVDDHPVVRKGLSSCLSNYHQVTVIGEAADGLEALRKARELSPDLVLMDIEMPSMNGLALVVSLRKENPKIKVLVLSIHSDSDNVLRMLQAGVNGFVLKQASTDDLFKAIQCISCGETFFSPQITRVALDQFVRGGGEGPHSSQISNREREVLIAVAEGLSNKEIACRLGLGVRTVETHRERIMCKLNIHSIAGLTKFAIAKGLVALQKQSDTQRLSSG